MKNITKHTLYDISDFMSEGDYDDYQGLYIYNDNQNTWLYRIMKGNYDGDVSGNFTLERDNIDRIYTTDDIKNIVKDDSLDCYDYEVYTDIDDLMKDLVRDNKIHKIFNKS